MVHAIVIGSGVGGLATAIRLARQGIRVSVYESARNPGGKITQLKINGFRFDAGPSLLTLPELVFELLDDDLRFPVLKLRTITKYFYPDGMVIPVQNDIQEMAAEFEQKLDVPSSKTIRYLRKSAKVYELTADLFIFGSFHRIKNLMNLNALKTLANFRKLQAFKTLHQFNRKELGEKHLVQLFDRYATYNGSNPYQTPATLSVISHLEHNTGAFIPESGMFRITESFYQQALRLGVQFHFGEPVRKVKVEHGHVSGILTDAGFASSDIVVSDIDILSFYSTLLPDANRLSKIKKEERSSSAMIFYWGMNKSFAELDIHNIFFSSDYENEFSYLFGKKLMCDDPTVYIYISKKYNHADAPDGCENWFVMVNAPADNGQDWDELVKQTRQNILKKLELILNQSITDHIVCERILAPPGISEQTGSVNGSLYGSSSNSRYASFNRHANFRNDIRGLYFVGGSVHPGGGIPLCLSSSKIVARLIEEEFKNRPK